MDSITDHAAYKVLADELADKRPFIQVKPGELAEVATKAEFALINAKADIYVHAEELQRPIVEEVEASKGRRTKVARFCTVGIDHMRDQLSRVARWQRWNVRSKDFVPTDPPRDVAAVILERKGEWLFLPAAGVITTPTLRPDGSILDQPGYDPATRLVLMAPPAMPAIPEQPTKRDAIAACSLLNELLEEFPFVDEASRSVALSELITPVVRGAMSVAPLHANRAPMAGSGKSFIVDIASTISSGQPAPVISAGFNEAELEKRLGAAMLRGQAFVSIDNLNGELRGDFLCQMIERPIVNVRPLGVSKLLQIESKATLFATGNNIVLVGDVVRRVILCSLDPELERPELRRFKSNPVDTVLADRGKYIAAALTLVRAYLAAGCPGELPPLASFEDWSRLVRSALVWLGHADPVDTMETARAEDPELEALRRIFSAWDSVFGRRPVRVGDLIETALDRESNDYGSNTGKLIYPDLNDALMEVAWADRALSPQKLGRWLKRHQGRIVNGLRLVGTCDTHRKQQQWRLSPTSKDQPASEEE